jgi:hypothetical protein
MSEIKKLTYLLENIFSKFNMEVKIWRIEYI